MCLFKINNFFLLRKIDTTTDKYLSHKRGLIIGIVVLFFLNPLEKTVIFPFEFLPELFMEGFLKNRINLANFIKNVLFLNLSVGVVGLCILVKILINKHCSCFYKLIIQCTIELNFTKIFPRRFFQEGFIKKKFSVEK